MYVGYSVKMNSTQKEFSKRVVSKNCLFHRGKEKKTEVEENRFEKME